MEVSKKWKKGYVRVEENWDASQYQKLNGMTSMHLEDPGKNGKSTAGTWKSFFEKEIIFQTSMIRFHVRFRAVY